MEASLGKHDDQLRDVAVRLTRIEAESAHTREKLDELVAQGERIQGSIEALGVWRDYATGAVAAFSVVAGILIAHAPAILRLIGGEQ